MRRTVSQAEAAKNCSCISTWRPESDFAAAAESAGVHPAEVALAAEFAAGFHPAEVGFDDGSAAADSAEVEPAEVGFAAGFAGDSAEGGSAVDPSVADSAGICPA